MTMISCDEFFDNPTVPGCTMFQPKRCFLWLSHEVQDKRKRDSSPCGFVVPRGKDHSSRAVLRYSRPRGSSTCLPQHHPTTALAQQDATNRHDESTVLTMQPHSTVLLSLHRHILSLSSSGQPPSEVYLRPPRGRYTSKSVADPRGRRQLYSRPLGD